MTDKLAVITAEPIGQGIVEQLKELLELAEKGALSSFAGACVYRSGSIETFYSTAPSRPLIIGAVTVLQHELCGLIAEGSLTA